MTDLSQLSPTRSAYLELKDERALVREGYEFLDEKRMIVAAEMLKQLEKYKKVVEEHERLQAEAATSLGLAVARHGIEGLSIYPAATLTSWNKRRELDRFLGIALIHLGETESDRKPPPPAVVPSAEAEDCRRCYEALIESAAQLASLLSNLRRLIVEYVRTERRARALENVLLPEINESIAFMEEQLEAVDQEEALRVHFAAPSR